MMGNELRSKRKFVYVKMMEELESHPQSKQTT